MSSPYMQRTNSPYHKGGSMKMLLLRLFNKEAYWVQRIQKVAREERDARYEWRDAIDHHKKSKDLRFKYELAKVKSLKVYQQYLREMRDM